MLSSEGPLGYSDRISGFKHTNALQPHPQVEKRYVNIQQMLHSISASALRSTLNAFVGKNVRYITFPFRLKLLRGSLHRLRRRALKFNEPARDGEKIRCSAATDRLLFKIASRATSNKKKRGSERATRRKILRRYQSLKTAGSESCRGFFLPRKEKIAAVCFVDAAPVDSDGVPWQTSLRSTSHLGGRPLSSNAVASLLFFPVEGRELSSVPGARGEKLTEKRLGNLRQCFRPVATLEKLK